MDEHAMPKEIRLKRQVCGEFFFFFQLADLPSPPGINRTDFSMAPSFVSHISRGESIFRVS
jgi:hypothetical protein